MNWIAYEYYAYAAVAVLGTLLAVWLVTWLLFWSPLAPRWVRLAGVVAPFINVNAMLFGLTLAFIGADTWSARDRAMDSVFREADNLRSLFVLAEEQPEPLHGQLVAAVKQYGQASANEFSALSRRESSPDTAVSADALLRLVMAPGIEKMASASVHAEMLRKVMQLRDERDLRVSLSRTHVNPMKWLGMASLGFLTIVSIAAVHLDRPRAGMFAILLFALAAAPSSAIVLVQGNPFQSPAAISAQPILDAIR